jgi:hypothetical protein
MPDPIRISLANAARLIGEDPSTLRRRVARGVFSVIRPNGKGLGRRTFLRFDEVKVFAETADEDAVRRLRIRMRRMGARYATA